MSEDPASYTFEIILLLILVMCSAFFSASETALMSINRIKLRGYVDSGKRGAKKLDKLLSNPSKLLSTILLGNNAVNIAASSVATSLAIQIAGNTGVGIATGIMTIVVLIFGEITPKSLAVKHAEKLSFFIVDIITILEIITTPIVFILNLITGIFIKILGGEKTDTTMITEEELLTMVTLSNEEGILQDEEAEIFTNVFEFSEASVKDVMIQRMDVAMIPLGATFEEIKEVFNETKYSRLPVYDGTPDNIVGILYAKDIIFNNIDEKHFDLNKLIREPYKTYEFIKIADLLKELRFERKHIAIVYDEYGAMAGLITMEDIVESILGDIDDEYDEVEESIKKVSDTEYNVLGNTKLDELNKTLNIELESEDCETIGGFIVNHLGYLPKENDIIDIENIKITISNVDDIKINELFLVLS